MRVVIRPTPAGLGVFAAEPIPRGRFVCLYAGEIIGEIESRRRWAERQSLSLGNYQLVLRETVHGGRVYCTRIDPTERGNLGCAEAGPDTADLSVVS